MERLMEPRREMPTCRSTKAMSITFVLAGAFAEIHLFETWRQDMLRMLLTTATAVALIGSGVYAQSEKPPEKPPEVAADATHSGTSPKFVAAQRADQWVFSKFKGTSVVGPDNVNVGAVSDLVFDRNGKIAGVIVGVGGFLGIGAKNVAIDPSGFEVVPVASSAGSANAPANKEDANAVKLKVALTKEQLMNAPKFQYYTPPVSASAPPATTGAAPTGPRHPLSQ
jgi:hypothetical protein